MQDFERLERCSTGCSRADGCSAYWSHPCRALKVSAAKTAIAIPMLLGRVPSKERSVHLLDVDLVSLCFSSMMQMHRDRTTPGSERERERDCLLRLDQSQAAGGITEDERLLVSDGS